MIQRFGNNGFVLGKKKTTREKPEEEIEQGGYVRRGSEYQQSSDWHHDANFMMGTKTTNFSDQVAASDCEESLSVNPVVKVPGSNDGRKRSKEELKWQTLRKPNIDFIRKSSVEGGGRDSFSGSGNVRKSTSNPLKSIWSSKRQESATSSPSQPCIVELRCAKNLPVMGSADDDSGTNPFVTMKIVPGPAARGRAKGEMRRWPYKTNTCFPIWNKTRDLGKYHEGDSLAIEIHHHGKNVSHSNRSAFIGRSRQAPVFSQLIGGASFVLQNVEVGREYSVVLKTVKGKKAEGMNELPVILTLRMLPPPTARKTVFIIRHAESKWNRAQRRHDLKGMANVDHGLSQAGREQAELLWRRLELEACLAELLNAPKPSENGSFNESGEEEEKPWCRCTPLRAQDLMADEKTTQQVATRSPLDHAEAKNDISKLWGADEIWISPLTRTIQTGLICLQGHPTLRKKGFTLTSDAREIKGIGGLDSIGVAKGAEGIKTRVEGELMDLYSHKSALSDDPDFSPSRIVSSLLEPNLDAGDATDEWWTNAFNSDKTEDVDLRLNELLNSIKFSSSSCLVLVSHSNLFRALLGRRVSSQLRQRSPELCKNAGDLKMKNCGLVRLELDFSLDLSQCIVDLVPIFCDESGVFEQKDKVRDRSSSSIGMALALRSRHGHSPPRSSMFASSSIHNPSMNSSTRGGHNSLRLNSAATSMFRSVSEEKEPTASGGEKEEQDLYKTSSSLNQSEKESSSLTSLNHQLLASDKCEEGTSIEEDRGSSKSSLSSSVRSPPAGQFARSSSPLVVSSDISGTFKHEAPFRRVSGEEDTSDTTSALVSAPVSAQDVEAIIHRKVTAIAPFMPPLPPSRSDQTFDRTPQIKSTSLSTSSKPTSSPPIPKPPTAKRPTTAPGTIPFTPPPPPPPPSIMNQASLRRGSSSKSEEGGKVNQSDLRSQFVAAVTDK